MTLWCTILIPTYNGAKYLPALLELLAPAVDAGCSLLFLDDCSTDESVDIIAGCDFPDKSIRRNTENIGLYATLNLGLSLVATQYALLIFQDDILDASYFGQMKPLVERFPEAAFFWAGVDDIDEEGAVIRAGVDTGRVEAIPSGAAAWRDVLCRGSVWTISGSLSKRDRLAHHGFRPDLPQCGDYEFLLRAIREDMFVYLEKPLIRLRLHSGQASFRYGRQSIDLKESVCVYKEQRTRFRDEFDVATRVRVLHRTGYQIARRSAGQAARGRPLQALATLGLLPDWRSLYCAEFDMKASDRPERHNVPRIAFVQTHPVQYVAPLYRFLNASGKWEITAIYLSDFSLRGGADRGFGRDVRWDIDLVEGYDARFVRGAEWRGEPAGFFSVVALPLWREIRTGGFDALIVHGHTPATMVLAAAAAKASRIPLLMRCETHLGLRRSGLKRLLRGPLIGSLYRRFDAALAIGSANREFYRTMGVREDRIFLMPYAVDNRRFTAASRLSEAERRAMRASLGVGDDRPIVLYASKFQARKRPDDLLRAAALLNREEMPFQIAMVGSGEMEPRLRAMARDLGLTNVFFTDFVNQSALPQYYGACDIFVLPSIDEPWGLAINEAMCAGLPVIASSEVGCVPDLVRDGRNGRVFPAGDITGLADALRSVIADAALRERMGKASSEIISCWSYAECEAGLSAALAAVGVPVRRSHEAPDAAAAQ